MENEFWDDLGRKVTGTVDMIGRKTEEVIEITKLKNKMYAVERELSRSFERLGREVYAQYRKEEAAGEEIRGLCEKTAQLEAELESIREEAKRKG